MHELSATESILRTVMDHAKRNDARQVTAIYLIVGDFSNIIPECVTHYWNILTEGTLCSQAELYFDRRPAVFQCDDCGTCFEIRRELSACPSCGGMRISFLSGDEMLVDSIEIIKDDEEP